MNNSDWLRFLNKPIKTREEMKDWNIDWNKFLDVKPGEPLELWESILRTAGEETTYRWAIAQSLKDMSEKYAKEETSAAPSSEGSTSEI